MSTPRGRGGERGGRGRGTSGQRGTTRGRGTFSGARGNGDNHAATTPAGPRAQNGEPRGGAQRGDFTARGGSGRGRGGAMNTQSRASSGVANTIPHQNDSYQARYQRLKDLRPSQRAQLIRERRMNPDGQMNIRDAVKTIGTCADMCPEFERVRRVVENDVAAPEYTPETVHGARASRIPDESRMVKAYKRSAAGMDTEMPTEIRSPAACLKTMKHMVNRLDDEALPFLHSFLWDRTRAIRKDLTTQSVTKTDDIVIFLECFEQCARQHLVFLHGMSATMSMEYFRDHHKQDVEQLWATSVTLKGRYDDNRRANILSRNEAEFQAYRLILSLMDPKTSIEHEVQCLPEHLRRNGRVRMAMQIYQAGKLVLYEKSRIFTQAQQNWQDFWNLIKSPGTSFLMACAAEVIFNEIRHTVLDTLNRAFRQGRSGKRIENSDWTLPALAEVLGFDTHNQVIQFCQAYGYSFKTPKDEQTGQVLGDIHLDFLSLPWQTGALQKPNEMIPQYHSKFVEEKRKGRKLSAVIQEPEQNDDYGDEESLFVPESTATKPADFVTDSFNSGVQHDAFSKQAETPSFNPSAPSFRPAEITPTNPFMANAQAQAVPASFGMPSGPSSFFSTSGTTSGTPTSAAPKYGPFRTPSGPSMTPNGITPEAPKSGFGLPSFTQQQTAPNPFAPKPTTTTSPATGQTVQPGLFDPSKNGINFTTPPTGASPFSNPFAPTVSTPATATPAVTAPAKPAEQSASQSKPLFTFSQVSSTEAQPTSESNGFNFAPKEPASSNTGFSFAPKQPSSASSASPFSTGSSLATPGTLPGGLDFSTFPKAPSVGGTAFPIFPQEQLQSQEEERQRAQREQECKAKEDKEARDRAARQAQEQGARRKAKEAIDRAKQEREAQRLREEEAQLAQQRELEERIQRQNEETFKTIALELFLDPDHGLLKQYVENAAENLSQEIGAQLRWEKLTQYANKRYYEIQDARVRRVVAHWMAMTAKSRRLKQARERRRRLNANRELFTVSATKPSMDGTLAIEGSSITIQPSMNGTMATDGSSNTAPTVVDQRKTVLPAADQPKATPAKFKKPVAPASASAKAQKTPKAQKHRFAVQATPAANNNKHGRASSQGSNMVPHKNPNAPIDRTQTDWFKLRIAGIDPSKHRKRSFGSASDEDGVQETDRKRRRQSTPSMQELLASRRSVPQPSVQTSLPLPPAATDEEKFARFRALQQKLGPPSTPLSVANTQPLNGKAAAIAARARELISGSSTRNGSPPNVQHEFSRSVPNLNGASSFGKSLGSSTADGRPAYWGRESLFVPRALYGKGPEALQEYNQQFRRSTSAASMKNVGITKDLGPLDLSSPAPTPQSYTGPLGLSSPFETQQSYYPEQYRQEVDSQSGSGTQNSYSGSGEEDVGEGYEEEDEVVTDYDDEEEEEDSGPNGIFVPLGQSQQNAQVLSGPGATEDDAIELSDSD